MESFKVHLKIILLINIKFNYKKQCAHKLPFVLYV